MSDNVLNRAIDTYMIDGAAEGAGLAVQTGGQGRASCRKPANVQHYAFVYLLGALGIVAYYLFPGDGPMNGRFAHRFDFPAAGRRDLHSYAERRAAPIWNSAFIFFIAPARSELSMFFWQFNPQMADYQFAEQYDWIPTFGIFVPYWYRRH